MRNLVVAATQMKCSTNIDENIANAERLVIKAASKGAQIILLQELFETIYFCQIEKPEYFLLASELENNLAVQHFSTISKKLKVVIPVSFFERKNNAHYNTVAVIDADGSILGTYRKTHIPDGPGYEEKFYFNPGDTGFCVWETRYATIGVGICWDQWFPESARCMTLMGAEVLFYPTAIGTEPQHPEYDSRQHWQTCIQGHSAANMIPVVISNRIGQEIIDKSTIRFYGSSFITDNKGNISQEADQFSESIILSDLDLDAQKTERSNWGIFRDRRPEKYTPILTCDGVKSHIKSQI